MAEFQALYSWNMHFAYINHSISEEKIGNIVSREIYSWELSLRQLWIKNRSENWMKATWKEIPAFISNVYFAVSMQSQLLVWI